MMERDRVLRPLEEARSSIEGLDTYESPAALQDALRATWHALELTLRNLLRSDPHAPDAVRLTALSHEETTLDAVITELRRRDRISLSLAGRIHELRKIVGGDAGDVEVRASHADLALGVVDATRREIQALPMLSSQGPSTWGPRTGPVADKWPDQNGVEFDGALEPEFDDGMVDPGLADSRRGLRQWLKPAVVLPAALLLLAAILALALLMGRNTDLEQGIEAFRADRGGVAEQHFRAALQRDRDNVTARLYLARVLRNQGRNEEAATLLREAARLAPEDAAVRRELGYLFMALDRPQQAATQFHEAVELDPDEPLGWVGLVESLYRAGDPSAELWLGRAPASAQAMLRTGRQ
ncbi:hypothetical protein BH23GEM9_BH23GEM9_01580 [soil metagenome]